MSEEASVTVAGEGSSEGGVSVKEAAHEVSARRTTENTLTGLMNRRPDDERPRGEASDEAAKISPEEIQYRNEDAAPTTRQAARDLAEFRARKAELQREFNALPEGVETEAPAETPQLQQQQQQQQPSGPAARSVDLLQQITEKSGGNPEVAELIGRASEQLKTEVGALFQQAGQEYLRQVQNVHDMASGLFAAEFGAALSGGADINQLLQSNPALRDKFMKYRDVFQHLTQQRDATLQASQRLAAEQHSIWAAEQDRLATQIIGPEASDPSFQRDAVSMFKTMGFSENELREAASGKPYISLRDARVQAVIAKAVRFDRAQTKPRAIPPNLPPVQRPNGARIAAPTRDQTEMAIASRRMDAKPSLKNAAAFVAARRRSG